MIGRRPTQKYSKSSFANAKIIVKKAEEDVVALSSNDSLRTDEDMVSELPEIKYQLKDRVKDIYGDKYDKVAKTVLEIQKTVMFNKKTDIGKEMLFLII